MASCNDKPQNSDRFQSRTSLTAMLACHCFYMPSLLSLVLIFTATSNVAAQLTVRVVDVGAGLCCVAVTSDGHYMLYDAGNFRDHGETAMIAIEEIIPCGSTIDLMVLSHCDADHIAAVPFICENYKVKEVWRDGLDSGKDTWTRADAAVRQETMDDGCDDVNLQEVHVEPGYAVDVGNVTATFLCGFADIPSEWGLGGASEGENKNARSVVVRLDHGNASIMFTGDTVGRHVDDPWNANIAAEAFLVNNNDNIPLDVDVMVAPHHGADNGSSYPFIRAASPEYVIFSAGSHYEHPRYSPANRFIASGVSTDKMFRTDLGDNEGGDEWSVGSSSEPDPAGDDDVLITLHPSGDIDVQYVPPLGIFETRTFAFRGTERIEVVRARSPQIAKWVENDALWQETEEDLEDHTLRPLRTRQTDGTDVCDHEQWRCRPTCCQRHVGQRLFGRLRRW